MENYFETIIKSITVLLVSASTILAIRIYYRNKRVELENSLFKSRLEAIGNIQMEMVVFYQQLDRMKVYLKNPEYLKDKNLLDLSFETDDKIYKCQAAIIKYAAYFSKETSKLLEKFSTDFLDDIDSNTVEGLHTRFTEYEQLMIKSFDPIILEMRKETGVDEIHYSLIKRFNQKT